MGWWSCDIMGGDSPLDIVDCIFQVAEGNEDDLWINPENFDLEKLLKHVKENWSFLLEGDDRNIFFQVLGVLMMKSCVPIPDHLKKEMINAANKDEWANDPDENNEDRKEVLNNFIKTLNIYDGTKPIIINSKGLFEVMAEKMGVTNKPSIETLRELLLVHVEEYRHDKVNEILD